MIHRVRRFRVQQARSGRGRTPRRSSSCCNTGLARHRGRASLRRATQRWVAGGESRRWTSCCPPVRIRTCATSEAGRCCIWPCTSRTTTRATSTASHLCHSCFATRRILLGATRVGSWVEGFDFNTCWARLWAYSWYRENAIHNTIQLVAKHREFWTQNSGTDRTKLIQSCYRIEFLVPTSSSQVASARWTTLIMTHGKRATPRVWRSRLMCHGLRADAPAAAAASLWCATASMRPLYRCTPAACARAAVARGRGVRTANVAGREASNGGSLGHDVLFSEQHASRREACIYVLVFGPDPLHCSHLKLACSRPYRIAQRPLVCPVVCSIRAHSQL